MFNRCTINDVAPTNISRKKQIISNVFCCTRHKSFSPFLSLGYVLSMFLNFEHFSALRFYRKDSTHAHLSTFVLTPRCLRMSTSGGYFSSGTQGTNQHTEICLQICEINLYFRSCSTREFKILNSEGLVGDPTVQECPQTPASEVRSTKNNYARQVIQ